MDGRPCVTRYQDSHFRKRSRCENAGKEDVKERDERSFPLVAVSRCLRVVKNGEVYNRFNRENEAKGFSDSIIMREKT